MTTFRLDIEGGSNYSFKNQPPVSVNTNFKIIIAVFPIKVNVITQLLLINRLINLCAVIQVHPDMIG